MAQNMVENHFSDGRNENDVVSSEYTTMATEEPSGLNTHHDYCTLIDTSGAGSVSALSLNDSISTTTAKATATAQSPPTFSCSTATVTSRTNENMIASNNSTIQSNSTANEEEEESTTVVSSTMTATAAVDNSNLNANNNNKSATVINSENVNETNRNNDIGAGAGGGNGNNGNQIKGKRRRRKSKKKGTNVKPYKKTNWKFQVPRMRDGRKNGFKTSFAPYNTNRFLMEEHMPVILSPGGGRCRDSSFSVDSDENLYDEEEFLSKEFSNVYEDARAERLEELSKPQLIQEYLQLEANYEKLSYNSRMKRTSSDNAKDVQRDCETQNHIRKLENHIKELTAENMGKSNTCMF